MEEGKEGKGDEGKCYLRFRLGRGGGKKASDFAIWLRWMGGIHHVYFWQEEGRKGKPAMFTFRQERRKTESQEREKAVSFSKEKRGGGEKKVVFFFEGGGPRPILGGDIDSLMNKKTA